LGRGARRPPQRPWSRPACRGRRARARGPRPRTKAPLQTWLSRTAPRPLSKPASPASRATLPTPRPPRGAGVSATALFSDATSCATSPAGPPTRRPARWVSFTATLDAASWGAELAQGSGPGHIYTVQPTGPFADDPNLTNQRFPGNPTRSDRSAAPLRVLDEVTGWAPHPPAQVEAMRSHLAQLTTAGVEAEEE
jgi:rifampin ADP-ribosylating transferase